MTEIDPTDLFPNERTLSAVLEGEMTQIHRGNQHAEDADVVRHRVRRRDE